MTELQRRLAPLKERWDGLDANVRLGAIVAVALAVAVGIMLYANAGGPTMSVLFSNLTPNDAARVSERLGEMQVPYETDTAGTAILVPESRVHEIRMTLAASGLPGASGVGFEIFDQQVFGESEFSEQVKYERAMRGELSRTISSLAGVEQAQVNLVLPERSLFRSDTEQASASVVLHLRAGWQLSEEQAGGIIHLVASSVRGLSASNVTVVDGEGRRVAGTGEDGETEQASESLSYRRDLEREKERTAQRLLDETMGIGRAQVRVAADVSFVREERTEEHYLPDEVAPRSFQIEEERDRSDVTTTAGVPGAASNLPGGPGAETGGAADSSRRRSETRNFEISKTVRHAVIPVGRVERLNVAVVVDGTWEGEGEERSFTPLPDDELDRIERIVASTVGLDSERGDRITVACMPFVGSGEAASIDPAEADVLWPYYRYFPLAEKVFYGLLALVCLFVARRWWKRRQKKKAKREKQLLELAAANEYPTVPTPVTVRELEQRVGQGRNMQIVAASKGGDAEELQLLAADLAAEDPMRAARVVRGWLQEEPAPQ